MLQFLVDTFLKKKFSFRQLSNLGSIPLYISNAIYKDKTATAFHPMKLRANMKFFQEKNKKTAQKWNTGCLGMNDKIVVIKIYILLTL
jgi:hypothetical protein